MHKLLSLFLLFFICSLHAQELAKGKIKKYNLSICAIFKNEARYLKEWIEYHRLVGIDHFYLYNNNSSDHFKRVLAPYIKQGVVTLVQWPDCLRDYSEESSYMWALSTQIAAYENAIKVKAIAETEWLVLLDVNEFLVPGVNATFSDLTKKYADHPGITFTTDCFDASFMAEALPKKLVIEAVELMKDEQQNIQKEVTKTIFKPRECAMFLWPPYTCLFKEDRQSIKVGRGEVRINRYRNRYDGSLFYEKSRKKVDCDSRMLSEHQLAYLLEQGFEIEDHERAIYRFVPEVLKKLGWDTGWDTLEGKIRE